MDLAGTGRARNGILGHVRLSLGALMSQLKLKLPKRKALTGEVARSIILRMVANFPGLVDDTEVSGADLVEWVGNEIYGLLPDAELKDRAKNGSPEYRG